jgi:hypothetical protein
LKKLLASGLPEAESFQKSEEFRHPYTEKFLEGHATCSGQLAKDGAGEGGHWISLLEEALSKITQYPE